jgi:xylulokinase
MAERYVIGVDLGTTLAKCALYDEEGGSRGEASRPMEVRYPGPGVAEQDAGSFYTVTCDLIRRCLVKSGVDPKGVAAIGIDSQMGGIMSVDRGFNPVTYYDTPLDNRSAEENRSMHRKCGDLMLKKSGSLSTYGHKILYWKKREEWKRIHRFLHPSAFVAGKLAGLGGGQAYMDESFICFSGLADLERSAWSGEICEALGVDMEKLPRILRSTEIIGETGRAAVEDAGLAPGTPVIAGCGDQAAGFVGAGVLDSGQTVDVSGTACIFAVNVPRYTYDPEHRTVVCMKSAFGGSYYLMSVVLGGMTHRWAVETFFCGGKEDLGTRGDDIYAELDRKAGEIPPGSDGLVSINYLQGRFFPPDPNVRGLFIGHTLAHGAVHFYRAVLESIAYDHSIAKGIIQGLVPGLAFGDVTAIGSGSKSALWMRIKADALQLTYHNLHRSDLATLGSAVLAGHSAGLFKDIRDTARRFVKRNLTVTPAPGADDAYRKYANLYGRLFEALRDLYAGLA